MNDLWMSFWSLYESGLEMRAAFEQVMKERDDSVEFYERHFHHYHPAPRWISVKEKMPDVFAWVAQCWVNDKGRVDCGYWDGKHWESMNGNNRTPAPTHWMPLPPPPEEG